MPAESMRPQTGRTTVVIITYNYAQFLRQAVESVLSQTRRPKVLVIDDASTDSTSDVVHAVHEQSPDSFDYYRNSTNQGLARTRNLAAQLVQTDWVVYLDADDWLTSDFIEKGEDWLDRHPDVDALTTDMFVVPNGTRARLHRTQAPLTWLDLCRSNPVVQTSFIRRRRVLQLGGYDPRLHFEDWDFWIRLLKAGGGIDRLPGGHVYRREHGANKSKICDQDVAKRQIREKHPRASVTAAKQDAAAPPADDRCSLAVAVLAELARSRRGDRFVEAAGWIGLMAVVVLGVALFLAVGP